MPTDYITVFEVLLPDCDFFGTIFVSPDGLHITNSDLEPMQGAKLSTLPLLLSITNDEIGFSNVIMYSVVKFLSHHNKQQSPFVLRNL